MIIKYLDLVRERKKLWNMRFSVIPTVFGAFGTDSKSLEKGLKELEISRRIETIQTSALLRSARILKTVRVCLSLSFV